ncbi:unnamed protein product [Bursaphelenchus okinawaensis]|uniref:Uncharacterized protein n=1 Tax=Bursaphelenchus okinawaensis TaxID=465554 RepID=A0A811LH83_9BILA|nr:unnamed protein product [Bursaphelenchus okinawaensis]CAG9125244.1 unnamed protein product [Bursaphelenchus okinawaensis]
MWDSEDLETFWNHEEALHKWQDIFVNAFTVAHKYYQQHSDNFELEEYGALEQQDVGVGFTGEEYSQMIASGEIEVELDDFNDDDLLPNTSQEINVEDEEEMSPEMLEYFKVTLEHREKRAREKLEEQLRKQQNYLDEDEDEYIEADKIGIYGPIRKSTQAPNLVAEEEERIQKLKDTYGGSWEKVNKMESKLNFEFESKIKEFDAYLWPNIAIRFS